MVEPPRGRCVSRRDEWAPIRRAFDAQAMPEPEGRSAPRGVSAVLLALAPSALGPALLYTRRTETLRSHPGEVSFPGGRVEAGETPLAAALRETEEEIGLAAHDVDILGHLTDFLTFRDVLVCAYVGVLREGARVPTEPRSREEVDAVFTVPVTTLLDPSVYEARAIRDMPIGRRVHYWHVRPQTIWGITGELTAQYLARAHSWVPPAQVRWVSEPSEFLPRDHPWLREGA